MLLLSGCSLEPSRVSSNSCRHLNQHTRGCLRLYLRLIWMEPQGHPLKGLHGRKIWRLGCIVNIDSTMQPCFKKFSSLYFWYQVVKAQKISSCDHFLQTSVIQHYNSPNTLPNLFWLFWIKITQILVFDMLPWEVICK